MLLAQMNLAQVKSKLNLLYALLSLKAKYIYFCKLLMVFPHICVYFAIQQITEFSAPNLTCLESFIQISWVSYQLTVKCTEASLISLKSQGQGSHFPSVQDLWFWTPVVC